METPICVYCNKVFSTKGNLNNHLKKAKYCIEKRNECNLQDIINECYFCQKNFTTKYMLNIHQPKCPKKILFSEKKNSDLEQIIRSQSEMINIKDQEIVILKNRLEKYESEIESYKQTVEKIALEGVRKPTSNITNILVPLDLSQDTIQKIVETKLTETHFLDSHKGIAKFCFDNLIKTEEGKRRLICSDPIRERYRYLDNKGNVREDLQAREFIEKVSKPIIEVSKKIHCDIKDKYAQEKEDIKSGIKKDEDSVYIVEIKEKYAEQCLKDIHDMPFESTNKKFRKELAFRSNV